MPETTNQLRLPTSRQAGACSCIVVYVACFFNRFFLRVETSEPFPSKPFQVGGLRPSVVLPFSI